MKPNYRRCISCSRVAHKTYFWRVVRVHPSYEIQLDRGMGRSAYICPEAQCIEKANIRKRLSKSLKAKIPEDIYQSLQERLSREC